MATFFQNYSLAKSLLIELTFCTVFSFELDQVDIDLIKQKKHTCIITFNADTAKSFSQFSFQVRQRNLCSLKSTNKFLHWWRLNTYNIGVYFMALKSLPNEKDLLAKIAVGDQRAFTTLFNHYHRDLFLFSIKLSKSEDIALEIVQDVFLKIWSVREKLTEVNSFGGYLTRIVRNHALNTLRQIGRQAKSAQAVRIDSEDFEDLTGYDPTDQQLNYDQALFVLNGALADLAPQQRKVYQLCHLDGLKYEEAAQALDISTETVKAHMKKALSKIREHFRKHAIIYPLLIIAISK